MRYDLGLVGHGLAPAHHGGGQGFRPGAEGGDEEVVQTADEAGPDERLRRGTAAFTAHEDLRRRRGLRERILAVHLLHEILAERNQEQDAQYAAQQGTEEHLPEIDLHPEDVDGREGEDGTRHDGAGAAADGLDDDVLGESVFLLEGAREAHGDDGDRDRRLEHLPDLEAEVGRRGGEQHHHQDAETDGIRGDLGILFRRVQDGNVFLAGLQLTLRILRERYRFLVFHAFFVFPQNYAFLMRFSTAWFTRSKGKAASRAWNFARTSAVQRLPMEPSCVWWSSPS